MTNDYKDRLYDLLEYHGVYKNQAFIDQLIELIDEYGLAIADNITLQTKTETTN